jgi:triphosphoribosyl-dephospho-CoA synthase
LKVSKIKRAELDFASKAARFVSRQLELAMLLEVSAYPKPGNVHRTRNYSETRFEHFLASAVAARTHFENAAERGILVSKKQIPVKEVQIGSMIRDAMSDIMRSHRGGNTSLGTVILLVPIAVAAGMTKTRSARRLSLASLRRNLKQVLRSTTPADAVALFEALAHVRPGGLGHVPELDAKDRSSRRKILQLGFNLRDVARLVAHRDSVCMELVTDYKTSFEVGYPYFKRELARTRDLNEATVNTYLKILSEIPDTLIARKTSIKRARWVTSRARRVLALGGLSTRSGLREIESLDDKLRAQPNLLNPGATADMTASVLALAMLSGYRP